MLLCSNRGSLFDNMKSAFNTPASMAIAADLGLGQMFVTGASLDVMAKGVGNFNAIRRAKDLEPNQPTVMMYLHCSADREANEQGRRYAGEQSWAARNHYAVWNAPDFSGVPGYEDYAKVFAQNRELSEDKAKVGEDGHIIGTPDEIIEKIQRVQERVSLEYLIVHPAHGSKPGAEARASLELFAKEVLPAVHEMETPINDHSLGLDIDPDAAAEMIEIGGAIGN